MLEQMTKFSLDRPKTVIGLAVILTMLFGLQFPRISIDTDPENMLKPDQPDRVFYNRIKKDFGIHDLIVVGIVDKKGIFRPESLERVARVTSQILEIKRVIIEEKLKKILSEEEGGRSSILDRVLKPIGRFAFSRARTVLIFALVLKVTAFYPDLSVYGLRTECPGKRLGWYSEF